MVGSMQRDVHAQLGVEDAERESRVNRARDRLLVAHDIQKRVIRVLDERQTATLGRVPGRTRTRRWEDRHGRTERLDCHRLYRAFTRHTWDSSCCTFE